MKLNILAITVLSALTLSAPALADDATPAAGTIVNGGIVKFKGEVVNAACAVDAGSMDQTIQLGQIRSAAMAAVGSTSSPVGFNIQLNDCDVTIAKKASVAFNGVTVNDKNPTVLALQGSAAGSATNIGIQILDSASTPLNLDGVSFSRATGLSNGTNIIPLQARYYATGAVTAGAANAEATFKVQYE